MKYYAVANDSAELMHFGIKGMKWGVRRTDAQLGHFKKSRSTAYHKASAKLNSLMQNGIKKAQTKWNTYNSPENKEYRAYNRAVNKQIRENKYREKLFEKHVQLARQGRLKYKGISDAEVERITDRLALERNARNLSGAERKSFSRRLGESISEGIVSGVGMGVSSRVSERISRGGKLKTQRLMTEQSNKMRERQDRRDFEQEMREMKKRDEYTNKRDIKREKEKEDRDLDREYHKIAVEQGLPTTVVRGLLKSKVNVDAFGRPMGISLSNNLTRSGRAKVIKQYKEAERIKENKEKLQYLEDSEKIKQKVKKEKQKSKVEIPTSSSTRDDAKKVLSESLQSKKETYPPVVVNVGGVGRRYSRNSSVRVTSDSTKDNIKYTRRRDNRRRVNSGHT